MKSFGFIASASVAVIAMLAPSVMAQQATSYLQKSDPNGVASIVKADLKPSASQNLGPRQRIQVYTGSQPLSQLTVEPLYQVRVDEKNIYVIDKESDGKLDATVTKDENSNKVTISFAQPVPAGKVIEVRLLGLNPPNQLYPKSLLYGLSGTSADTNQSMPLGIVQVQTYGPR
jgi:Protein of unknown function (DUF2808)